MSITIPGWVVAVVLGSLVWFFAVRAVLRAVERRYWTTLRTRPRQEVLDRLVLFAGPVVWIVAAVEAVGRRVR